MTAHWVVPGQASAAGRAVGAAVIGYVVQSAFTADELDVSEYVDGLTVLSGSNTSL